MTNETYAQLGPDEFIEVVKRTPLVSIDLIVNNDRGRILLGLRKNEPAKGYWFVPGGRILKDEPIAQAFERIAYQELGIRLPYEDAEFVGVFEHLYPNNFTQKQDFSTHYVVLAHKITIDEASIQPPDAQHSQYKWLDPDTIRKDDTVHPYVKAYFKDSC
ncbi:MAG: GDP-mannose mannosyl hydrolase [Planctomycetota bacterium]|jgi:colanic acid biosynthesis protein WcaH